MRKQYYFRSSPGGILAWDVDRLVRLARELPRKRIPLSAIHEFDELWIGENERPTWRSMVGHIILVKEADLSFPIILSANGAVMDGRHRIMKAACCGMEDIEAVQFEHDPDPDHVGFGPEELPY